ncbi:hypothetical protein UlMin_021544 [Ulmus minor]
MKDSKPVKIPLAGHFKFSIDQCPSSDEEKKEMEKVPYSSAVAYVMFTMISIRPDISHAISVLNRFMSNPGKEHWVGMKWLLRYLKGSSDVGLIYEKRGNSIWLEGYSDSDYGADRDKRRSITSYFFNLNGCCISWKTQLQPVVALSTTEAEYIAATEAIKEALWWKGLLEELKVLKEQVVVYSDSQSALHLCKNPVFHERTKHVDVRYHFIRENVTEGNIHVDKMATEENPADLGTKVLTLSKFKHCLELLRVGTG